MYYYIINTCIHIYIYIERERDVYTYIYIERERDKTYVYIYNTYKLYYELLGAGRVDCLYDS